MIPIALLNLASLLLPQRGYLGSHLCPASLGSPLGIGDGLLAADQGQAAAAGRSRPAARCVRKLQLVRASKLRELEPDGRETALVAEDRGLDVALDLTLDLMLDGHLGDRCLLHRQRPSLAASHWGGGARPRPSAL